MSNLFNQPPAQHHLSRVRPILLRDHQWGTRRKGPHSLPSVAARISLTHLLDYIHKLFLPDSATTLRSNPECSSTGVSALGAQVQIHYNGINLRCAVHQYISTQGYSNIVETLAITHTAHNITGTTVYSVLAHITQKCNNRPHSCGFVLR